MTTENEYNIPCLVKWFAEKPNNWAYEMVPFMGSVIHCYDVGSKFYGPFGSFDGNEFPGWSWRKDQVIPHPTPEQVTEEQRKAGKIVSTKQPKPKTREELEGAKPERDAHGNIIIPEGWEMFRHQESEGLCYDPESDVRGWQHSNSWAGSLIRATYIRPKTSNTKQPAPPPKPTKTQREIAATEARLATLRELDQAERDLEDNKTKGGELAKRVKELQAKLWPNQKKGKTVFVWREKQP